MSAVLQRRWSSIGNIATPRRSSTGRSFSSSVPPYRGSTCSLRQWIFWTIARGDTDELQTEIVLIPLRFNDKELERSFEYSLRRTYKARCFIMSISGLGSTIALVILLPFLYRTEVLSSVRIFAVPLVFTSLGLSMLFYLALGIIPHLPCLRERPETYTLCALAVSWTCSFIPNVWQSIAMTLPKHATSCAALKLWVDFCTMGIWLNGIIVLNIVFRSRTRYTIYLHVLLFIFSVTPHLIQFFIKVPEDRDEVPDLELLSVNILCLVQALTVLMLISVGYFSRWYKELQERAEFLRSSKSYKRIMALLEERKRRRTSGATTIVETLIDSVERSKAMVKAVGIQTGNTTLEGAVELLQECFDLLGKTDELFALRFQRKEERSVEQNYYNFYANKNETKEGLNRNMFISGELTAVDSSRFGKLLPRATLNFIVPNKEIIKRPEDCAGTDWDLDILEMSNEHPTILIDVGFALLKPQLSRIGGTERVLLCFLTSVYSGYLPNPYHNSVHGAMVAHVTYFFARNLSLFETGTLKGWEISTIVVASLCHDLGHPGRNNNFFVAAQLKMAQIYNDVAALEQYHSLLCFSILMREDQNIFASLSLDQLRDVRKRIIELILATDMSQHFESLSRFRLRRRRPDFDVLTNSDDWWLLARMSIKSADLGHALVGWSSHVQWSLRVTEEFYQQGDDEKARNNPVSPLCDRLLHGEFAKSQKGFLEFVVQPLIKELEGLDVSDTIGAECMRALVYNKYCWETAAGEGRQIEIPQTISDHMTMTQHPVSVLKNHFETLIRCRERWRTTYKSAEVK